MVNLNFVVLTNKTSVIKAFCELQLDVYRVGIFAYSLHLGLLDLKYLKMLNKGFDRHRAFLIRELAKYQL